MNNGTLHAISEKIKLRLRMRKLLLRIQAVESENKELRTSIQRQEWFETEFKHEMLNRLAAAERH